MVEGQTLEELGVPQHGIEVDTQAVWCGKHKARVFLDPRRRFDLASVRLFDYAIRDPRITVAAGYNPLTGARGDPARLTEIIRAHSPLCCFIPGDQLEHVYKEAYYGAFEKAQMYMIREDQRLAERYKHGYRD